VLCRRVQVNALKDAQTDGRNGVQGVSVWLLDREFLRTEYHMYPPFSEWSDISERRKHGRQTSNIGCRMAYNTLGLVQKKNIVDVFYKMQCRQMSTPATTTQTHPYIHIPTHNSPSFLSVSFPQNSPLSDVRPAAGSQLTRPLSGPGVGTFTPPAS
jgi:hypothetical protein